MKTLFNQEKYDSAKSDTLLQLMCYACNKEFSKRKSLIRDVMVHGTKNKRSCKYCSRECSHLARKTSQEIKCTNCSKLFVRHANQIKKTINSFCSQSCSALWNNTHKTKGTRISKLETWLQSQLTTLYPNLIILYNDKTTINSELDIYIPSLKLAFELNGIFHYEPIYGPEKLQQIQNNDDRKFQACIEHNISLCIIDSSKQKYFKESTSTKYLDIITTLINKNLNVATQN